MNDYINIHIKFPEFCNSNWKKLMYILGITHLINPIFWIVVIIRLNLNFAFDNKEMIPIYQKTR